MSEQDTQAVEQEVKPQATEENVATAENAEPETAPEEQQPESKVFTEDEVNKIVQKRIAKLERKYEKTLMEAQIRKEIEQQQAIQPAETAKPKESDYETYGEYIEALADWKTDQKLAAIRAEEASRKSRESQQSEAERYAKLQQAVVEDGESKYDDFEDVVAGTGDMLKSKGLSFSKAMVSALIEAENAADIAYHLGKNLDEAARIAALPAYAQAKEIGKLEDKLLAKPKKQISKAPEPITPVSSGKASNDTTLDDNLPIDEWMRRRNKQVFGR